MDDGRFDRWAVRITELFTRRGLGRLSIGGLGYALNSTLEANAKKKKKRKKKKRKSTSANNNLPLTLQLADASTRAAILSDAAQSPDYAQLLDFLEQGLGMNSSGDTDVWSLSANQDLARTVLMRLFVGSQGRQAILAYGHEATGDPWAQAFLSEDEGLVAILVVGAGGNVEFIDPADAATNRTIAPRGGSGATSPRVDVCESLGTLCNDLSDPCFQCKGMCSIITALILKYGGGFTSIKCGLVVAPLCGPAALACGIGGFAVCASLLSVIGGTVCDARVCKPLGYCQVCEPTSCGPGQYFDQERCTCLCRPGTRLCDGKCVDTRTDRDYCGDCETRCGVGQTCIASGCVSTAQYRIVLKWGPEPSDLDSHLWLPVATPYHVAYYDRGNSEGFPHADLDQDDTTSFGPETITIFEIQDGTYRYAVHNYSSLDGECCLATSGATVQLFLGTDLIREWAVPTSDNNAIWWHVFDLRSDGGVVSVNQLRANAPAPYDDDGNVLRAQARSDLNLPRKPLSESGKRRERKPSRRSRRR